MRNVPVARLVSLPDGITSEQAAAMMLKGMTVQYLIKRTDKVSAGETVLFHAAAGGVGLIACQWLKALGVTMIGTAGSDEKCALAKAHGAAHCINYKKEDFVARRRDHRRRSGRAVVYDEVEDTFRRLARMSLALRDDGVVRERVRRRAAVRSREAEGERST